MRSKPRGEKWLEITCVLLVAVALLAASPCLAYNYIWTYNDKSAAFDNVLVNDPTKDYYMPLQYGICYSNIQSQAAIGRGPGSVLISAYLDNNNQDPEGRQFTGWSVSKDRGATWVDKGRVPISANGDHGTPVFAKDESTGVLYLSTNWHRYKDLQNGANLFRITFDQNGDPTMSAPVNCAPGYPKDHVIMSGWIAVDNFPGREQGTIYYAFVDVSTTDAQNGGIFITRSTDGGLTFGPSRGFRIVRNEIYQYRGRDNPVVVVGPDHTVYVFYQDTLDKWIRLARSYDGGQTFTPAVNIAKPAGPMRVAVHPVTGALYLTYQWVADDLPEDTGDVFFTQSLDGGSTWSPTIRLNDDNTKHRQSYPSIAITPDGRALAVTWYDSRNSFADSACKNWDAERYAVVGLTSGDKVQWGQNFPVSTKFGPGSFGTANCDTIYGYEQITADNEFFYTVWEDWRDLQPVCLPEKHNDANVRFAKFPVVVSKNATVNAASYTTPVASASIASVFGVDLAAAARAVDGQGKKASTVKSLEGTQVTVRDAAGNEAAASLFFVSAGQVNLQIPETAAPGKGWLFARNGHGNTSFSGLDIARVAPGIFTADGSGQGVPSGYVLRVRADGTRSQEEIYRYDSSVGRIVPVPIDLGPVTDQVFLILFGTGIRNVSAPGAVWVSVGGIPAQVFFAGAQGDFLGLDQINVLLPRTVAGFGTVNVELTVDGKAANPVAITIGGAAAHRVKR